MSARPPSRPRRPSSVGGVRTDPSPATCDEASRAYSILKYGHESARSMLSAFDSSRTGCGILAMFTFWPGLILMLVGIAKSAGRGSSPK